MASHAPPMKNPPQESDRSRQERSGGDSIPSSLLRAETGHYALDCGIMLGVGAAFDIHAGLLKDAPDWVKNSGLQWLYRLCQEPRRLWRRYLDIVPKFLWLAALQLLGVKKYSLDDEELSSP